METPTQLDVIAVGAHPDDIEIACGGSLARLVQLGHSVGIVDLTDGEPTPNCDHPDVRRGEAIAAAKILGVHRVILDLPNRRLFDSFEARLALATEFRKYRPQLVIGLGGRTPTASPDHWQAMQITDAAVFYSRLTKWDDQFAGLAPHKIAAQLHCRLSFEANEAIAAGWECIMDISETLSQKLESVRAYKTQFPPEKEYVIRRVEAVARYVGAMARFTAGEVFYSARPLATKNVFDLVVGTHGRCGRGSTV
jgi:LmbE family N-acetylglucosaminyl deacetylase